MKKILALLAVATLPAMLSGCAACCPTGLGLCPCCPCNWWNRPAPCPPAPAYCPPAPAYAAPLAASCCPPTATQMMPQYVMPTAAPFGTPYGAPYGAAPGCSTCQVAQPQPMYYQAQPANFGEQAYYGEMGCGYVEQSCGAPFMGMVSYGPSMPCECGGCEGGCCDSGAPLTAPAPEGFVPGPAND